MSDPWKNTEPSMSLLDQLRKVSEYDEGDETRLAQSIEHAKKTLGFIEAFGFQRPYVYPGIDDDDVRAEWPSDWNVSLSIFPDGSMRAFAIAEGQKTRVGRFTAEQVPQVCDFLHETLPIRLTGREGRFGAVLA